MCSDLMTRFTCIPMGNGSTSGDLYVGHNDQGQHMLVDILHRGKQQYTQNNLITCLWKICAAICQIKIINGCCDLENNVKVKLFIWYEGLGKDN